MFVVGYMWILEKCLTYDVVHKHYLWYKMMTNSVN
jgi:hypothetical protein